MKLHSWMVLLAAAPASLLPFGCESSGPTESACVAACPTDATCTAGACVCDDPARTACGTECVDLAIDSNQHCGACDRACTGNQLCSGGGCIEDVGCTAPSLHCGLGICVDGQTDSMNCGTCGKACGTGQTCTQGVCG